MAEGSGIDEARAPLARQAPDVGGGGVGIILARHGDECLARHQHRCGGKALQPPAFGKPRQIRSEEHTSELQSLMRISYAVLCLKKKKNHTSKRITHKSHPRPTRESTTT